MAIDGVALPVRPGLVYFLVYKEPGMVSTADDPQGRPIVTDMYSGSERVYPVGRLDADSEGLILLTNDGDLTHRLTHPSFGVEKTYVALVDEAPSKATFRMLRDGVELDDGMARVQRAGVLDETPRGALVQIVMTEGRKREVRRLMEAVGHPVRRLVRIAIGPLRDRDLKPGTGRHLDVDEVRDLYAAAGTDKDAS